MGCLEENVIKNTLNELGLIRNSCYVKHPLGGMEKALLQGYYLERTNVRTFSPRLFIFGWDQPLGLKFFV